MEIKNQGRKEVNFHPVKSLSDFKVLQFGHSVMGFKVKLGKLTSSSIGRAEASFFCVCRRLHITQKNAPSARQ